MHGVLREPVSTCDSAVTVRRLYFSSMPVSYALRFGKETMKWIMSLEQARPFGHTNCQLFQDFTVTPVRGVTHLGSLVYHCHAEGEVSELEGGHPCQGGTHHAGMLEHLLHRLLLPLLLLLGQTAQLTPQRPPLSIVLPSGHRVLCSWGGGGGGGEQWEMLHRRLPAIMAQGFLCRALETLACTCPTPWVQTVPGSPRPFGNVFTALMYN